MPTQTRRIGLVSCSKQKLSLPARAQELYISPLFRKSRKWAERNCEGWFILSAKYGLVSPSSHLRPYEQTLKSMTAQEKRRWAVNVFSQLQEACILKSGVQFTWLAGQDYKKHLSSLLNKYPQLDPMRGLRMGKRLKWLNKNIGCNSGHIHTKMQK